MSEQEKREMTPGEKRAHEAVRALSTPAAAADFRERLKQEFTTGTIVEGDEPTVVHPERRPNRWRRIVPLAAAAALLLVVVAGNRGAGPTVVTTSGEGVITIDGHAIPADRTEEISKLLRGGSRIELDDEATLDVHYPGSMVWQYAENTSATLPRSPGRWFNKNIECALVIGESRLRTSSQFPGTNLTIRTDEGMIAVTGTLISTFRDEAVTCVCVHEGTAEIGIDESDLESVPAGQRKIMFRDGSAPKVTDIAPPHRDHLIEFDAKHRDLD